MNSVTNDFCNGIRVKKCADNTWQSVMQTVHCIKNMSYVVCTKHDSFFCSFVITICMCYRNFAFKIFDKIKSFCVFRSNINYFNTVSKRIYKLNIRLFEQCNVVSTAFFR